MCTGVGIWRAGCKWWCRESCLCPSPPRMQSCRASYCPGTLLQKPRGWGISNNSRVCCRRNSVGPWWSATENGFPWLEQGTVRLSLDATGV